MQSKDSNDFNLNLGDEDKNFLAYLNFGMNGNIAEMQAWLGKIIAYKGDGTYEDWWNHSDQTRLQNELAKLDDSGKDDEDYQPGKEYVKHLSFPDNS